MASAALPTALQRVLAQPQAAHAFAVVSIGVGVGAEFFTRLVGWAGVIAMVATLVAIATGILLSRRGEIEWQGLLPVSLLVYVGWATVSITWSQYQWSSLGGIAYLLSFTIIGVTIALTRDTIQIVRAAGDVFRVVLVVSFVLEIFAGVLIDAPLTFIGVEGRLAELGPIQGVMGSRNQLGLIALLALITFAVEFATKSIGRDLAIFSLAVGGLAMALSRSPVAGAVLVVVAVASVALALIRRVPVERRTLWQLVLLGGAVVVLGLSWLFRAPIIALFEASSELDYRLELWNRVITLGVLHPLEGWGWVGLWRPDVQPFPAFDIIGQREPTSALNAYIDVWFQLGLVGTFIFAVLALLTFTRSWLLAGRQRSVVIIWPALILLALLFTALAESSILVEYGWLLFVICSVKAARELSWRSAFRSTV